VQKESIEKLMEREAASKKVYEDQKAACEMMKDQVRLA